MEPMVEEKHDEKHSRIKLYFSVFILDLVFFASGCAFAWTSPTLPKLMTNITELNDSRLSVNTNEASWIVSLLALGNMLGPFTAGFLLDVIGRRWTIFLDVMCILISWIIMSQTFSVYMLYIGRFIIGISVGISFTALPLYIAEISEDSIRGFLNNLMQCFVSSAVVITYSIGPFISYNGLIIFCCAPCVLFLVLFPWLPETPYYLIAKKRNANALLTLQWLRGGRTESCIEKEMKLIQVEISESMARKSSFKDLIFHRGTRHALFITSTLLALQQLTGIGIVILYTETIFKMIGTPISSSLCAITVGTVMLFSGCFSPMIVSYFGYKKPLLASALGITIALGILAAYLALYLREFEIVNGLNWIPIFAINMFIMFHTFGFSTIPWALTGEFFSPDMKTLGAAIGTCVCASFIFTLSNLFPNLVDLLGMDVMFFVISIFSFISFFFVLYFVPNTNGMSLAEIQELFNDKHLTEHK